MSDIQTRLKSMAIVVKFSLPEVAKLLEEAADKIERLEKEQEESATMSMNQSITISNTIAFLAYHITAEEKAPLPAEEAMQQLYERLTK